MSKTSSIAYTDVRDFEISACGSLWYFSSRVFMHKICGESIIAFRPFYIIPTTTRKCFLRWEADRGSFNGTGPVKVCSLPLVFSMAGVLITGRSRFWHHVLLTEYRLQNAARLSLFHGQLSSTVCVCHNLFILLEFRQPWAYTRLYIIRRNHI